MSRDNIFSESAFPMMTALANFLHDGGDVPTRHKSRDARKKEVETAVQRLQACTAKTHQIAVELKESWREAAEESKRVLECLEHPAKVLERDNCGECEEDLP